MRSRATSPLVQFIQASNPLGLLAGALFYALGAGAVAFRNQPISWVDYWLGQSCITLLQMSSSFLKMYYDWVNEPSPPLEFQEDAPENKKEAPSRSAVVLPRLALLQAGLAALSIGAAVTILLFARGALSMSALIILGLAFLLAFFYGVPPIRLAYTGYGELAMAILVTNLTPAFAFMLLAHELDARLLGLLTFPFSLLYLAMALAVSLEHYYRDFKRGHRTMMVRLGWQRGMVLHNLLVPLAYLLIGFSAILGISWHLSWPAMLTLPIGAFQVWQMWQIGNGAPPRWPILRLTAYASLGVTAYLITFSLWMG